MCEWERSCPTQKWGFPDLVPNAIAMSRVYNCHQGSSPSLQYLDILSINWLFIYVGILKIYLGFSVPTHLGTGLSTLAEKKNSDLFKVSYIEVASHKAKKIYGEKHGSSPWELIISADLRPQGWDLLESQVCAGPRPTQSWPRWTGENELWALASCQHGYIFNLFWLFCFLVGSPYLSTPPYKLWPVSAPRLLWRALCSNWNCRRSWLVSQLAREGSDKWHLESQMQSWGFLRLASKASQWLPMAPGLQARVLVLSRVPYSSAARQGDPGAHRDSGTASAGGHGQAVAVSMQRLSPPWDPACWDCMEAQWQLWAGCPVGCCNPGNCSSAGVEASLVHQSFCFILPAMGYFELCLDNLEIVSVSLDFYQQKKRA